VHERTTATTISLRACAATHGVDGGDDAFSVVAVGRQGGGMGVADDAIGVDEDGAGLLQ